MGKSRAATAQEPAGAPGGAGEARIAYMALGELQRWPGNPKGHKHEAIGASIARFGFNAPLLLDERTGRLVAGHGRLETLQAMKDRGDSPPLRVRVGEGGDWMVPVTRGIAFASDQEAEAYLLADNRLSEIGGWDEEGLATMMAGLPEELREIAGWSEKEIAKILGDEGGAVDDSSPSGDPDKPLTYSVIVDFSSEHDQGRLVQELEGRGMKCRLLIS